MSRVRVEAEAWYDLMRISEYLAGVGAGGRAMISLVDEFERKCEVYARQPGMGDLRDDLGPGRRSFTFRRWYVAIYQPLDDGIRV